MIEGCHERMRSFPWKKNGEGCLSHRDLGAQISIIDSPAVLASLKLRGIAGAAAEKPARRGLQAILGNCLDYISYEL